MYIYLTEECVDARRLVIHYRKNMSSEDLLLWLLASRMLDLDFMDSIDTSVKNE